MVTKITEDEIREIARTSGPQFAHDLLLLHGPDFFDGDYGKYTDLIEGLASDAWELTDIVDLDA